MSESSCVRSADRCGTCQDCCGVSQGCLTDERKRSELMNDYHTDRASAHAEITCKGSWQLGNNCRTCKRCIETKPMPCRDDSDYTIACGICELCIKEALSTTSSKKQLTANAAKPQADNLIPAKDKWEFDANVTAVFSDMLVNSVPGYADMRNWVTRLGRPFVKDGGVVIDIGASRGDALAPFMDRHPDVNYYAVEISEPMRDAMKERFKGANNISIVDHDLRTNQSVFEVPSNLILSVLTLMFIPVEHRTKIVNAMYKSLKPGGALILVEKTIASDPVFDELFNQEYYRFKADNGYTQEAIYRKKLSLEGVLVPLSQEWNTDLLERAGFKHVQVFWRACNFVGLIAIKE